MIENIVCVPFNNLPASELEAIGQTKECSLATSLDILEEVRTSVGKVQNCEHTDTNSHALESVIPNYSFSAGLSLAHELDDRVNIRHMLFDSVSKIPIC